KYAWAKGSSERLKQLPEELFEMIKVAPQPTPTATTTKAPRVAPAPQRTTTGTAAAKLLQDIKTFCCCLSVSKLDNYATWLRVGMVLKKLGAPLSL
ncbi:MAG: hypothetical protein ACKPKO_04220, partial [Candidatus Fonsibacter sp.]